MQSKFLNRALPVAGLLAVLAAGYNWWSVSHDSHAEVAATQAPIIQAVGGLPDFSAIAKAYGPSVVNITIASDGRSNGPGVDSDNPAFDFFRHFGIPMPRQDGPHMAEGSGFIVSSDGLILTNAHVVADSSEVTVKLTDKREFKAKVIGYDRPSDVAVIKIAAKDLPVVRQGNPDQLNVGEWVLAIGSPFGFDNSVTAGIVSAKARALPDENYVPFIQTDVAVNPGNSGGPLFNMKGEVVGINSQIYSRSGGYQGLSFAIPIDIAMKVEDQIVKHGKVVRGRIGAAIQDLNQDLAASFGLKSADGALVASVERNSPADKAGLQPGDVVLAIDGHPVAAAKDLPALVAEIAITYRQSSGRLANAKQLQRSPTASSEHPLQIEGILHGLLRGSVPRRLPELGTELVEASANGGFDSFSREFPRVLVGVIRIQHERCPVLPEGRGIVTRFLEGLTQEQMGLRHGWIP